MSDEVELPKEVKSAITLAAVRAKFLFDTYQWKWTFGVPTVKEIEDRFIDLTKDMMLGKENGMESAACGRLVVTCPEDVWMFHIIIADTIDADSKLAPKTLANSTELGLED
jgi:hypothetical protein